MPCGRFCGGEATVRRASLSEIAGTLRQPWVPIAIDRLEQGSERRVRLPPGYRQTSTAPPGERKKPTNPMYNYGKCMRLQPIYLEPFVQKTLKQYNCGNDRPFFFISLQPL